MESEILNNWLISDKVIRFDKKYIRYVYPQLLAPMLLIFNEFFRLWQCHRVFWVDQANKNTYFIFKFFTVHQTIQEGRNLKTADLRDRKLMEH